MKAAGVPATLKTEAIDVFSVLKMEVAGSTETLVPNYQSVHPSNPRKYLNATVFACAYIKSVFIMSRDSSVEIVIRLAVPYLKLLDAGFPLRRPGFASGQHVGFVVDKAALGQVFSEYCGVPC
jgi:hypothetical protein